MNVLDSSIANVSLPAISGDLGVSTTQGTWVITSFAVANAIAVPLTGFMTQRFGQVRLFMASVILFMVSSLLCGLAPNMTTLILFRALQGFVAGPMIPLSQTLLLSSYPRAKAGLAMAMWSMTTLVAPVMGPLLGGWITDNISWPWIFYINIPVGIVAAGITWALYRKRESNTHKVPIDAIGLALLVLWVGSMQLMLDKGKELDWFHSPEIVTMAVIAVVGFAFFLIWELTDKHPVVDLSLFKRRNFWSGAVATAVAYGLFFGNVVLLPLWLQQWMGYTATQAGMIMAPVGLLAIFFSPVVGLTVAKIDPRRYATFSFLVFALVLWMRSNFNTQADFVTIIIPTIIQGIAMAFFFIPLVTITLSGLTPDRIPAASGLSNFLRITAGAMGTSITTTLWENRAALHHSQLAESVNPGNNAAASAMSGLASSGLSTEQVMGQINRIVDQQAFMLATNDIFYASAILFLLLIPLVWLAKPQRGGAGATPQPARIEGGRRSSGAECAQHVVARPHGVVVGLAGRAFFVADLAVVGREDAVPGAMAVVDEMRPAVRPDAVVPVPVAGIAGAHGQQGGGGKALGLHPEVLVAVAHRAVGVESINEAAMRRVPAAQHRGVEEVPGARHGPVRLAARGNQRALQLQQQLGPLGQVPGLEAPGPEDVALVAAVVVPVDRPVFAVVLPDQSAGQRRLPARDRLRQRERAIEVARVLRGLEGRKHRFAGVHVGVLAAVRTHVPVGAGFVGIERVPRLPEMPLHQLPGGLEP